MSPLSAIAAGIFLLVALWGGIQAGETLRVGGPLDDLHGYGSVAIAAIMGLAGTLLGKFSGTTASVPGAAGGSTSLIGKILAAITGGLLGGRSLGFVGQVVGLIEAAVEDSDHKPCGIDVRIYWDNGTITPIVAGNTTGSKTQQPAPAQAALAPAAISAAIPAPSVPIAPPPAQGAAK